MNTNNAVQLQDKIDGHDIYPRTLASLVQTSDGSNIEDGKANKSDVYTKSQVNALLEDKQNTLVSGSNIKTINGQSLLGDGNITVAVESDKIRQPYATEDTSYRILLNGEPDNYTDTKQSVAQAADVSINPVLRQTTFYSNKDQSSYPITITEGKVTFGGATNYIDEDNYTGTADKATKDASGNVISETYMTKRAVQEELAEKQDTLESGVNIKTVNNQSLLGRGNVVIDSAPDLSNYYTKDEVDRSLRGKQNTLTFDETPQRNSPNVVKSGGVESALAAKQNVLVSGQSIKTINGESILGSGDLILAGLDEAASRHVMYKALKQGEEQMLVLKSMGNLDIMPLDSSLEQFDLNEDGTINYSEISIIYAILLGRPYDGFYYKVIHQTEGDSTSPLLLQKSEDRETWTTVVGKNPDLVGNDGSVTSAEVSQLYTIIETIAAQQGIAYDRTEFTGATTVFSAYNSKEKKIIIGYNFERYIDPTYNMDDFILLKLDPSPNVIYCNSFNNKLYRWNVNSEKMVELNLSASITPSTP